MYTQQYITQTLYLYTIMSVVYFKSTCYIFQTVLSCLHCKTLFYCTDVAVCYLLVFVICCCLLFVAVYNLRLSDVLLIRRDDIEMRRYINGTYSYPKTAPWLSPIHKEGSEPCFIYTLTYGCPTFTSRVFFCWILCQSRSYSNHSIFHNEFYISLVK